jgi:hypothetical protein
MADFNSHGTIGETNLYSLTCKGVAHAAQYTSADSTSDVPLFHHSEHRPAQAQNNNPSDLHSLSDSHGTLLHLFGFPHGLRLRL